MIRASELTERISDVTGIELVTVTRYARFAREAGYLSQSGRGNSAARMEPLDVANLLACIITNGVAQDAGKYIRLVQEMQVGHREADHLSSSHLSREQNKLLKQILPIVFNRQHTLHELLLALTESAIDNHQRFLENFTHSCIYFTCDEYDALVDFSIQLHPDQLPHALSFGFQYNHRAYQPRSEHYRKNTQLFFSGIARIGALMAAS